MNLPFTVSLLHILYSIYPSSISGEESQYPDTKKHSTARLLITTSRTSYSGTDDNIYATFIGDFATSGPYSIGTFEEGGEVMRNIPLQHLIGDLQAIHLYNNGTDGWLMTDFKCFIDSHVYEFEWERQWLDTIDPVLLELYGNGYEPQAQAHYVPALSTQTILTTTKTLLTDISGIYRPDLVKMKEHHDLNVFTVSDPPPPTFSPSPSPTVSPSLPGDTNTPTASPT